MARHKYLITYPDGSKKHIGRTEREQMELRSELRQTGARSFEFTGIFVSRPFRCNDLSGLSALLPTIEDRAEEKRDFLPGYFVIEYPRRLGGRQVGELLQTTAGMVRSLKRLGQLASA